MPLFKRRVFLSLPVLVGAAPAFGQFRVEITGIGGTQLPIAVAGFRGEEKVVPAVSGIVRADLERSGFFRPIDAAGALDEIARPAFAEWRAKAADALVAGSVARLADGRIDVRSRLWDVVKGADLGGLNSAVDPSDLRLSAHRVSDFVYEKLTGLSGVFSTRIAYVALAGGRYTLRVADADGEGGQVALTSPEPIISPAWSPEGRELAYVSFESRKAVVYVQEVASGARRILANYKGSNSAPAWSPDGKTLAVTLSRDGGSQIHVVSRQGDGLRRVTQSASIDTEPVFAPDGQSIYFVSDRGGSPQIYRTGVNGGNVDRISFAGSYNISPAISPDGRSMAYVNRQGNELHLMLMDLGSGNVQALTDTRDDESPSFSPNGRHILYATRAQGKDVLMTTTLDGKIKARLVSSSGDVREPCWGPYRQ